MTKFMSEKIDTVDGDVGHQLEQQVGQQTAQEARMFARIRLQHSPANFVWYGVGFIMRRVLQGGEG